MANPSLVPTSRSSDLATFTIRVGGTDLASTYHVLSVVTAREVNRIPWGRVVLLDGDPAKTDFEASNSAEFVPGNEIEVLAGYHGEEEPIFKGLIVGHGIKVRQEKPAVLTVECRDPAVAMTLGRKSLVFVDSTDSDAIEDVTGAYDIEATIESSAVTHDEIVQFQCSDWDFMLSRLDSLGHLAFVADGKLQTGPPKLDEEPVLSLAYGGAILELEAATDARDQAQGIKTFAWDYAAQERIEAEGAEPASTGPGNFAPNDLASVLGPEAIELPHTGQVIPDELQAWADGRLQRSRLSKVRGRVRCQGFRDVSPGETIELSGVGERFSGKCFVSAVRHEFQRQTWETDIQFGLTPSCHHERYDVHPHLAAGLLPGVRGLQIGVARQLQDDPAGEHRVLVNLPLIDPDGEGVWARVATLDAGDGRGSFFRPEIGDEVVLGFLNDDPRDPVILGMLHSSAKPAPIDATDDNHEKGFVTRSEMRLHFDDDKKEVTLDTPEGNKLVLSEDSGSILIQDQNDNKALFDSAGINVESPGDITIKASGNVTIEGTNVDVKASAQLKGEGSSGAELSSGGTTVVKGSIVQIN